ncbi:MAG: molybdopterin dehydrogenase [Planctomycetes bacterium]|nr:molybdopterin dehydrogenase [Planctomycetota bacterium]
MKRFEYAAPRSEAEIAQLLAPEYGKTEILAGGTDLVELLKKMVVTPDRVVNIMEVDSLKTLESLPDGSFRIGAAVTLDDLAASPYVDDYPALAQAIAGIASMQLQAQGTIGGDLCHRAQCWFFRRGEPLLAPHRDAWGERDDRYHAIFDNEGPAKYVSGSRLGPALIALGAQLRIVGPKPDESSLVPASQFFRKPKHDRQRETILQSDQFLSHIILPPADGRLSGTYEVRSSAGPDYPLAAASCAFRHSGGVVREITIVLGQVAPVPYVALDAMDAMLGMPIDATTVERAAEAAIANARALNQNASKIQWAKVAVKRSILVAARLDTGGF